MYRQVDEYDELITLSGWEDNVALGYLELLGYLDNGCQYSWCELNVYHNKLNDKIGYGWASGNSGDTFSMYYYTFADLDMLEDTHQSWAAFTWEVKEFPYGDDAEKALLLSEVAKTLREIKQRRKREGK